MKTKPTPRQQSSVACPTCGVAAGKRCILGAGGLRNGPHAGRRLLAAGAPGKKQGAIIKSPDNAPKKKGKDSYAAILVRMRKQAAKPYLTKSVREKATKKQIALWNAD